ncbi:MAG: nitrous oxide reductase family maturation protein NosD [Bacteroidetes bacterium]|nr:nitrous oxide reductase family maturation protein NosD [Bacteroidota bacterium]
MFSGIFKIFLLGSMISVFTTVSADTLYVKQGSKLSTIKQAIATAQPNDVIQIKSGIYKERNILIEKSLSIIGEKDVIIDGENKGEIFTIASDHVNISRLTLKNTGYSSMDDRAAIKLLSASFCVIDGNTIENTCFGIYLLQVSNCVIKNNKLRASAVQEIRSGNGIHVWKSDSLTIKNNTIEHYRDGIYFEFVTHAGVYDNISKKNLRYGIHFMFSNNDEYTGNTFTQNGSGVAVMFSKNITITKNIFSYSEGGAAYGVLFKEITDAQIENNIFSHNTVALYMEGSNRLVIKNNLLQANGRACSMQANCYDVQMTQNNFIGNTFDIATNGTLSMNDLNGNYWDKYEGYDLDKNGIGDVHYTPVSLYSVIIEKMPYSILLYRSLMVYLLDRSEKVLPGVDESRIKDHKPLMKAVDL